MVGLNPATSLSYLEHARWHKDVFEKADNFVGEEIEPKFDENDDSVNELDADTNYDDNSF